MTHPLSRCHPAAPPGLLLACLALLRSAMFRHKITFCLWWTCGLCKYQIFQNEDLPCHKRIRHLDIVHKMGTAGIPVLPKTVAPSLCWGSGLQCVTFSLPAFNRKVARDTPCCFHTFWRKTQVGLSSLPRNFPLLE